MSTHRHLFKSAGIIGGLTALSRVLGFVRDVVIATAFGTGIAAEAFVVSFKLPNLLRDLVGEGAANAAFVPVLTECREKKKEDFWPLVSTLFCWMSGILLILSILGMVFAPGLVALIAPGFSASSDPEKFPLTVSLTRVIFPYVFLIGLSALAMGVLNSLREFTSSALGPVLLNISMIAAGFFFEKTYGPMALVAGVLAGGVLQLAVQVPSILRLGFKPAKPNFNLPAVRKIGTLLLPRALGSALYQINVFVDSILASFESIIGPGGQSALYYSNRLFQLPLAVFAISLSQAILPAFSSQVALGDREGMQKTMTSAVRWLVFIVLPAATGLVMLARPIVRIIFEHGQFDVYSTEITSMALFYYAFGLLSCALIKIFVNAFYAMNDTRTPVKIMFLCISLNVVLSLILMRPMKIGGLTLASSISATMNVALLYHLLIRKTGKLEESKIFHTVLRAMGACLLMAGFVWVYNDRILERFTDVGRAGQGLILLGGIAAAVAVYLCVSYLMGSEETRKILKRG